jgi:hypothetical protein
LLTPIPNPIAVRRDDAAQAPSRSSRGAEPTTPAFDDPEAGGIDWGDLAEAAAEDAEGREGGAAQVSLCVAARIAEDRLGDPLAAVGHLEAALARGGGAPLMPVLRGLRDLALETGSILGAIDALDQEVVASGSNARRADLLVEKASLFADHLLLPVPARAAVEEALRLAAGHPGALGVGQALAERAHDPVWLRAILEQRLRRPPSRRSGRGSWCGWPWRRRLTPDRPNGPPPSGIWGARSTRMEGATLRPWRARR